MLKITHLTGSHDRESFDCGNHELNKYVRETATQHEAKDTSRTYVAATEGEPDKILGYYTLTLKEIPKEVMPVKYKRHPRTFPGILLGKLAVSKAVQRQGLGELMLLDAMAKALEVSAAAGGVALFVDAIDQDAWHYYHDKYGFLPLPDNPQRLFLPMAQVAELLAGPPSP